MADIAIERFALLADTLLVLMTRRLRYILAATVAAFVAVSVMPGASAESDILPGSSRMPAFHRSQQSGAVIAQIRIPAIGLEDTIRAGVSLNVIDQGVAYWAGTALPGRQGNFVLAGHRTTYSAPFSDLDRLRPGNLIFVSDGDGVEIMYRVTETFIVEPSEIWITYDVGDSSIATLFACHPKGSARQRIVVRSELVGNGKVA